MQYSGLLDPADETVQLFDLEDISDHLHDHADDPDDDQQMKNGKSVKIIKDQEVVKNGQYLCGVDRNGEEKFCWDQYPQDDGDQQHSEKVHAEETINALFGEEKVEDQDQDRNHDQRHKER